MRKGYHSVIPVLLAGGCGSRLEPISTPDRPKQFLNLLHPRKTLFQQTLERAASIAVPQPIVISNQRYRRQLANQIGAHNPFIMLEPEAYNTAFSILCSAFHLTATQQGHKLMLVMPCDHYIESTAGLKQSIDAGMQDAKNGALVTFGIQPDSAVPHYGYILAEDRRIVRFVEKPSAEQAAELLLSENRCYWNSGIFLFTPAALLREAKLYAPELVNMARYSVISGNREADQLLLAKPPAFPVVPFDKAVMERTQNGVVIPLMTGWCDIGNAENLERVQTRLAHIAVKQQPVLETA